MAEKVFVGLSGGVDSAVSAALLQQEGYDVTGVFIKIQIPGYPCPAREDRIEAMRVAAHLRIPFMEVDLSKEYEREVFRPSIAEYEKGRTPNPDTLCNEKIKFGAFYDLCRKNGADFVATGHYAQIQDGRLYKSADASKDQTYFLWMVHKDVLQHVLFPVGHLKKDEVRRLAKKFGLPNNARPDSQGLCFLGDLSVQDMLQHELSLQKGKVLSENGEEIGTHDGAALYTLGQRHGFEVSATGARTLPHYVIAKDVDANTITVSTERFPQGARATELTLSDVNWIGNPEGELSARYRYRQTRMPARMSGTHQVILEEPHYAPEGQSLVLYKGEECIGGGVISSAKLKK